MPAIDSVIRQVAGNIIKVAVAPDEEDRYRATDFVVTVEAGAIACRVRRERYHVRYRDFTLRCQLASGAPTELAKIRQGFARWYLYAWAQEDGTFIDWVFIDLDRLRQSGLLDETRRTIWNIDRSSAFVAFSLAELRDYGCIVAEAATGVHEYAHPQNAAARTLVLSAVRGKSVSQDQW